jgi:hypothetical protein
MTKFAAPPPRLLRFHRITMRWERTGGRIIVRFASNGLSRSPWHVEAFVGPSQGSVFSASSKLSPARILLPARPPPGLPNLQRSACATRQKFLSENKNKKHMAADRAGMLTAKPCLLGRGQRRRRRQRHAMSEELAFKVRVQN